MDDFPSGSEDSFDTEFSKQFDEILPGSKRQTCKNYIYNRIDRERRDVYSSFRYNLLLGCDGNKERAFGVLDRAGKGYVSRCDVKRVLCEHGICSRAEWKAVRDNLFAQALVEYLSDSEPMLS